MDIKHFFSLCEKNLKVNSGYKELDNKKMLYSMVEVKNTEKKEQEVLKRVSLLPESLVKVIKEYIPVSATLFLEKPIYLNSRGIIMNFLKQKGTTEKYIRYIIRRDFDYVFGLILHENIVTWVKYTKKYPYNNMIYTSYIYFLIDYCIEHESNKCKEKITDLLQKLGLWKKDNKKIKTTCIRRWR